jgi:hypothetical protein
VKKAEFGNSYFLCATYPAVQLQSHSKFVQHADQSEFKLMVQLDSDLQKIRKPKTEPQTQSSELFYQYHQNFSISSSKDRETGLM